MPVLPPLILVEAKFSEIAPDPSFFYFKERLGAELALQVVWNQNLMKQVASGFFVLDIFRFLKLLV